MVEYAGFWRRFLALLIDSLVLSIGLSTVFFVLGIFMVLTLGVGAIGSDETVTDIAVVINIMLSFIGFIIAFIVQWLYFAIMESSSKQATLGKMAIGIKVTDLDGNRISFGRATGRYFAKILSAMIFYIGFFMAGWTKEKQALHDMIAGTLVVKD